MRETMTDLERQCIDAGIKMTGQRRTILKVLSDATDHPSVEDVYQRAKEHDASISIATVYRTLHLLDDMNLVQRHDFNQNFARFEVNLEHHHHLVDLETGRVIEFQNEELEELKARIADELGYELVDHRLELYGRRKKK
ncbi:MAG: transcriptional repressor [Rhodospirillaceae bacterium]|nr:transcriptional repressor [Rhodospirillaceae bacterium]MCA8932259.1 transcriptional repressor [Rhodospirillaceae bacterium]